MSTIIVPCSGFIILSKDKSRTVVVSTHADNLGFPKGKRNRSESYMDTALRELEEETGLTKTDIDIVDGISFDEMSLRGHPATRYFVASVKDDSSKFSFDEDELSEVKWINCSDLFESDRFRESRKTILKEVLSTLS